MEPLPMACSLDGGDLRSRYVELSRLGAAALIESQSKGPRHRLRFRRSAELERKLEAVVAAEAKCCPFLDLSIRREEGELVLTISGPPEAEPVSGQLAAAFGAGAQRSP
jgi:hypothetical protein